VPLNYYFHYYFYLYYVREEDNSSGNTKPGSDVKFRIPHSTLWKKLTDWRICFRWKQRCSCTLS